MKFYKLTSLNQAFKPHGEYPEKLPELSLKPGSDLFITGIRTY